MKKFKVKKILVPTDFSETAAIALGQAAHLAKLNSAEIKLLHVITPVYSTTNDALISYGDQFYNRLMRTMNGRLKEIAKELHDSLLIDVTTQCKLGIVDQVIADVVKKEKFDIIFMGTHGTSGIREKFIGSNAYRVVDNESCPVITIQRKSAKKGFKTIVLPIRLELTSRQKVNSVAELAKIYGSKVLITGFSDSKNKYDQNRVKQYVKQVEEYLGSMGISYSSSTILEDNFIKEIILHAKKNKADLIAITINHDRTLDQFLKGPYAQQFVNHSSIPVMSVPVTESADTDLVFTPYLSGVSPV
jgi:nucleotide-binding universal stress UspA family protein